MTRYKVKWKKVYIDIIKKLIDRPGGNSLGHHTFQIDNIIRSLSYKYDKDVIKEGLERLVRKEDLKIWPKETSTTKENYAISINLNHFNDLKEYLKNRSDILIRLEELGKEIGIY